VGQASVSELLDEGIANAVLDETPDEPRRYRFAHALIRETLCDDVLPGERAALHLHVGEAIESFPGADADVAELAHHFAAAGAHRKAVAYALRAADRALALFAYEEAARLYGVARRDFEQHLVSDAHLHCEILLGLGEAQTKSGDIALGKATLAHAAALAKQLGLREHFMRAALQFGPSFMGAYSADRDVSP